LKSRGQLTTFERKVEVRSGGRQRTSEEGEVKKGVRPNTIKRGEKRGAKKSTERSIPESAGRRNEEEL